MVVVCRTVEMWVGEGEIDDDESGNGRGVNDYIGFISCRLSFHHYRKLTNPLCISRGGSGVSQCSGPG